MGLNVLCYVFHVVVRVDVDDAFSTVITRIATESFADAARAVNSSA